MKIDHDNVREAVRRELMQSLTDLQMPAEEIISRVAESAINAVYGPAELRPEGQKGQRWPDGMDVPADWIEEAQRLGLARERALVEAQKFADHWTAATGQNARKRNWRATWRNWIRRVAGDQVTVSAGASHARW